MKKMDDIDFDPCGYGAVGGLCRGKGVGKIAVASDVKTITGPVGFRMGRSPYYLLFDGQGKFLEAIDNPFKDAGGNAAGRSGKSALDSLRFDEKGGLIGGVETPPKEEREKVWNS